MSSIERSSCSEKGRTEISIAALRQLIQEDPQLRNLQSDDGYLLRFLYSCHFKPGAAFQKMKRFYDMLQEYPEWFAREGPLSKRDIILLNGRVITTKTDRKGRPLLFVNLGNSQPESVTLLETIIIDDIMGEHISGDIRALKNGLGIVLDAKNCPWGIMSWLNTKDIKLAMRKMECHPLKIDRVYVVNSSMLFTIVVKMITFHTEDWNDLHEHIAPDQLPAEYGGTGILDIDEYHEELFLNDATITESFRINRTLNGLDMN